MRSASRAPPSPGAAAYSYTGRPRTSTRLSCVRECVASLPGGLVAKLLLANALLLMVLALGGVLSSDLAPLLTARRAGAWVAKQVRRVGAALEPLLHTPAGALRGGHNISGDDVVSFNVIMTSNGDRPTLQDSLRSLLPQLQQEDFVTLISDANHLTISEVFANEYCNCTKLHIANVKPLGWWGHGSRSRWQKLLPGTFHMNADDDDLYPPNAFAIIRSHVRNLNNSMYVFRMVRRWDEEMELIPPMWVNNVSSVRGGTVGTPCVVYRAIRENLPDWTGRYGGDGDFFTNLKAVMNETIIIPEVIYHVGQLEDLMPFVPDLLEGKFVEPHDKVLQRKEWRRKHEEAPPQRLPAPKWIGLVSNDTHWQPSYACESRAHVARMHGLPEPACPSSSAGSSK